MNKIETMKGSEAVEIGLRSGHVLYGRFRGLLDDGSLVLRDPDGTLVFVPSDNSNIAYIKIVAADPEISAHMNKLYGPSQAPTQLEKEDDDYPPPRRVDSEPDVLDSPPQSRQSTIEAIKERHRHNTSFTAPNRPYYRPTIVGDEKE